HYRVAVDAETRTGSFLAAPPSGASSVSFCAFGDTRTQVAEFDGLCARMGAEIDASPSTRQTLVVHAGDWISLGDSESGWDGEFFSSAAPNARNLMSRVPIMGCRGNHEQTGALLRSYWPYAYADASGFWHSFDYGPVHFTVIDQYAAYADPSAQYAWIANDLAASGKRWKVALFHEPAWSAGGGHPNNTTTQTELEPLFRSAGVRLILAGHNHYYARCSVGGIQHLTVGGGGAPLHIPDPLSADLVTAASAYSFARFDVAGPTLTATVLDSSGAPLDGFTLTIPYVIVSPASGLVTSERGRPASFTVVLSTTPSADATVSLSSSDPGEGTVSPSAVTFTPADALVPRTVTVTGADDDENDGTIAFTVLVGQAVSADPEYDGIDADDVEVENEDDDPIPGDGGSCGCAPGGGSGGMAGVWALLLAALLARAARRLARAGGVTSRGGEA
ncbi:MAG: metallophosphoesterase, partial [Planctomycetes bacterium]|nr:metallophosphoesterase [Planctomycetota bacterium]